MRPRRRTTLITTLCLLVGSSLATEVRAADEAEGTVAASASRGVKSAEQTIRDLEARIEALEAQGGTAAPVAADPEATAEPVDTGEAPSPAEEREAELGLRPGRPSRVVDRGNFDDRQVPAARPGDYMFDPDYRGFIPVPRTILAIKFNARPRVDMMTSSSNPGDTFRFVPALIPPTPGGTAVPGGGWQFNGNANGSQLRVDVRAPDAKGDFRFYYQNDFFGSDTANMRYRLQHLYGQYMGVVAGFTYGIFEDPDAWPDTIDYEGPNSVVFARRALLHYQKMIGEDWQVTVGLENPDVQVDTTGTVNNPNTKSVSPDAGFNVRWTPGELGHVQFSTILRSIAIDDPVLASGLAAPDDTVFGWGMNIAGSLRATSRNTVQFWFVYGEGVGSMGNDTSFLPSDAALDATGQLVPLEYWSTMIALTHAWTPRWRSTGTFGYVSLENTVLQSPLTFHTSKYASLNLTFQVLKRLSVGLEGLYGEKELLNGTDTDLFRIQLGVVFSFFD